MSSHGGPSTWNRFQISVVDQPPLAVEHPVPGDEGRDRRHRPGQDEHQQQRLHPPFRAHEEAGEQQCQEQFHVHADRQIDQRVDHRLEVDRIVEQAWCSCADRCRATARRPRDRSRTARNTATYGKHESEAPRRSPIRAGPRPAARRGRARRAGCGGNVDGGGARHPPYVMAGHGIFGEVGLDLLERDVDRFLRRSCRPS